MKFKIVISLLVGLCVLLAPVLSNAAVSVPVPVAHAQDQADCHSVETADSHAAHGSNHTTSTKAAHGCCYNFVGILLAIDLLQPELNTSEPIPFSPSLGLASRAEGLYRPPRQNS